jgi:pyruvate/2-oxoglutarate dehydrogenase complex dihydrolipoamide dehydrogenase (E3) component
MKHYDLVVLGGGSAGYAGARTAKELGKSVAIVDQADELGGLCILHGCMPSKTLIYSAEVLHLAKKARTFGLRISDACADFSALQLRKKEIIKEFQQYRASQLEDGRFDLYRNFARFTGNQEITLDNGTILNAEKFLVATGSSIATPPVPGLSELPVLTSNDILSLDRQLDSIIVLGGGIVACELSQFLQRTGTSTSLIQRHHRILKSWNPEVSAVIENAFIAEGMNLHTATSNLRLEKTEIGFAASFEQGGNSIRLEADHLLNALGRIPNTEALNLDAAGVRLQSSGHIATNGLQQSSNPAIYAAGDCAGPHEIVHIAILQGECAVKHAFGQKTAPMDYDPLLLVVFTDPQAAVVGLTEHQLEKQNIPCLTESYPFNDHGKAILMEAKKGYVKVIAHEKTGQVLGAECVGKDAGELIHPMSIAVSLKAKVQDLARAHWYHPTLSEIWSYPLEDLSEAIE